MLPINNFVYNLSFEVAVRKVYYVNEGLMYILIELKL